ncbi:carbohydrate ABC transporter membrane protein 2 (CUT1 family) [Hydrogenispora ethanolica]|uniref:Carbohydrate ABC transporter membrane protein 2 (CUT1 family) n=1 Tax=Hydrogenispora ethanolica TaxID=1082276 RepID=A0A4R1RA22_HYDET|nr:carbohydrate ABC transporter permease [Hydrogenispora ethanolica]TCL62546.1 carbohydrate ABC transporter membrane protein 2 (CUT1 family) [Hydrogenispora ethanolica]
MRQSKLKRFFTLHLPLALFVIYLLFPFYWSLCTSLKREETILQMPIRYLPIPFTLDNYINMWRDVGFSHYFTNSLIVSFSTTVLLVLISLLGGYAFSRYKFAGKGGVLLIFLFTQMLPGVMLIIPLFEIFKNLGIINRLSCLTFTYTTIQIAFCTIMMSGFFSNIPKQMEEAAQIDGCSLLGAIFRVIVPTIAPGIVATGAFAFIGAWNDFVYALAFMSDTKLFTLPLGLSMMQGEFTVNYGGLTAGNIIALIPVMILFAYIQKYLVTGLSAGAVKG